jgi:hypothetical protein
MSDPVVNLDCLPLRHGLHVGCWQVWGTRDHENLLIVHRDRGVLVRVWIQSNGWFEFRTGSMAPGIVYTVYSNGEHNLIEANYLDVLAGKHWPRWHLADGVYPSTDWELSCTTDQLIVSHEATQRKVLFDRHSGGWSCNDAKLHLE